MGILDSNIDQLSTIGWNSPKSPKLLKNSHRVCQPYFWSITAQRIRPLQRLADLPQRTVELLVRQQLTARLGPELRVRGEGAQPGGLKQQKKVGENLFMNGDFGKGKWSINS